MIKAVHKRLGGAFTLVELMIVVAIIALLAAIAVPNFLRARKRSQATRVLEDFRLLDNALDQYAAEHNKIAGDSADFADLKNYIKTGTLLYSFDDSGALSEFGPFTVDSVPKLHDLDRQYFSEVTDSTFWSPYY